MKFIKLLEQQKVRLSLSETGELLVSAPKGVMTKDLSERIRNQKADLITFLQQRSLSQAKMPKRGVGNQQGESLSPMQLSLWLTQQIDPESRAYNVPLFLQIDGLLDCQRLAQAIIAVYARHDALRTRFKRENGKPLQFISNSPLHVETREVNESELQNCLNEEAQHCFDLTEQGLFRAKILILSARKHVLCLHMHHIITDGWSNQVLLKEISNVYNQIDINASVESTIESTQPLSYLDYSVWYQEQTETPEFQQKKQFWLAYLEQAPALIELPKDKPRTTRSSGRGALAEFTFPDSLADELKRFFQAQAKTPYQILLSAFSVFISHYSGQDDVVVGTPFANRTSNKVSDLVGYLVNSLPVRLSVESDSTFMELIEHTVSNLLSVIQHQDYPFEQIVAAVNPMRNLSHAPVFQNFFTLEHDMGTALALGDAHVTTINLERDAIKFDLSLNIRQSNTGFNGVFEYNTELFEADTMQRFIDNFIHMLSMLITQPQQSLSSLEFVTPQEQQLLDTVLDNRSSEVVYFVPVQQRFMSLVSKYSDKIAVSDKSHQLTYKELDHLSSKIASFLQTQGVEADQLVGVCLGRTTHLVAAIIGIMKAGATYVPLDPKYPATRLQHIQSSAELSVVLAAKETRHLFNLKPQLQTLQVLDIASVESHESIIFEPHISELSHVIFTSGSTGKPKGIQISNKSVAALMTWVDETYDTNELACVLFSTSICFDLSVFEIWAPLLYGGKVSVVDDALELVTRKIPDLTLINTVPSALKLLLEEAALPTELLVVNVAGEALDRNLVNQVFNVSGIRRLFNLYGPSEDTTYSTAKCYTGSIEKSVTIGAPITHTFGKVVNSQGVPVCVGAPGELYLGGLGLSNGYLGQPELTAERFIVDAATGERLYKTGDVVRVNRDGELEYIGRSDNQTKLRGYRIELEEIEHVLLNTELVSQAVVVVNRSGAHDALVAFVVGTKDKEAQNEDLEAILLAQLETTLPDYMVPSALIVREALPMTLNGKINRQLLANESFESQTFEFAAPVTMEEIFLATLWKELIKIDREVSRHDDFFRIGGNSLLAMQMVSRVNTNMDTNLSIADVFSHKTLLGFAKLMATSSEQQLPLSKADSQQQYPLSLPQVGAWGIANMPGFETFYNMLNPMFLRGQVDVDALTKSLQRIVNRHACLRAHFVPEGEQVLINIGSAQAVELELNEYPEEVSKVRESRVAELVKNELVRPFSLTDGPLFRASLTRFGDGYLLMLNIHHLVCDAWSINILKRELAENYSALVSDTPVKQKSLEWSYADYSHSLSQWHRSEPFKQQIRYWHETLSALDVSESFPLDYSVPVTTFGTMKYFHFDIDNETVELLQQLAHKYGTTMYNLYMALFHLSVSSFSGVSTLMVYSPVAGRTREVFEPLFGLFVNMVCVTSTIEKNNSFEQFIEEMNLTVHKASANADVSMMAMMQKIDFALPTLPSMVFNFIDLPNNQEWQLNGLEVEQLEVPSEGSPCLTGLDCYVRVQATKTKVSLGYNTQLFNGESAEKLSQTFEQLVFSCLKHNQGSIRNLLENSSK